MTFTENGKNGPMKMVIEFDVLFEMQWMTIKVNCGINGYGLRKTSLSDLLELEGASSQFED